MRVLAVAMLIASLATTVRAEDKRADEELAEARRLEAALDYQGALVIVERVLAHGGADIARYVELHLLAGKLAGGLERPDVAEAHFARAIAIQPAVALPAGTSPKQTLPFERARARSLPLQLSVTRTDDVVTLILGADPLGLVVGIEVVVSLPEGGKVVDRASRRVTLPKNALPHEAYALDAAGNRLWMAAVPDITTNVRSNPDKSDGGDRRLGGERRGTLSRWPAWAVLTGLAVGTGMFATVKFYSAQDEFDRLKRAGETDFTVLQDLETSGRRWGWTANIAFGAGVVTGLVTIAFSVRGDHGPIALRLGPGPGTGLAIAGEF